MEEVKPSKVVICSDSAAALQSIKTGQTVREDLIIKIYMLLLNLQQLRIDVHFCWIPAHVGIEGNEIADKLAKSALNKNYNDLLVISFGRSEAKTVIHEGIMECWQEIWDNDRKGREY